MLESSLLVSAVDDIIITEVENKATLKQFILLPWTAGIYENDEAWVPPIIKGMEKLLSPEKSYFFEIGEAVYFLAYKNGKPAGRISAHINRLYEDKYDNNTGFFGFFECVNDIDVARALFNSAEDWLRQKGKKIVNGPQSFSIYDSVGFDVAGNSIMPATGICHFAPYYSDLVTELGYSKCIDWHCVLVKKDLDYSRLLGRLQKSLIEKSGITFTTLEKKDLKSKGQVIKDIFNKAWEGNWGHLPLTEKQFLTEFYSELSQVVIPELTFLAEKDGVTVGFIINIPDINPALKQLNGRVYPWQIPKLLKMVKQSKNLRTIIMGVLPEYRRKMIDTVFYLKTIETGIEMGFESSDCSLIVETNKKFMNSFKTLGGEIYKTYRIFEKQLL
ncbi:MAG: hypothetical protein JW864_18450 [Spirochaetes bacterium]|nr:hypothetical protein [Spirochaetota bacterium]